LGERRLMIVQKGGGMSSQGETENSAPIMSKVPEEEAAREELQVVGKKRKGKGR